MIYGINKQVLLLETSALIEEAGKASMRKKGVERKDKKFEDIKSSDAHKARVAEYPLHNVVATTKKDMRNGPGGASARGGLPSVITKVEKEKEAAKKEERDSYKLTTSKEHKFEQAKKHAQSAKAEEKDEKGKDVTSTDTENKPNKGKKLTALGLLAGAAAGAAYASKD